jgi:hypothetical protein
VVARERAAARAEQPGRVAAHGDSVLRCSADAWDEAFASFERLSIAAPSIDVDTTDGYAPELAEIVAFVNRS